MIYFVAFISSAQAQDSISDFDGNYYQTVTIKEQTWMAENLRSEHDASGKMIDRICYGNFQHNCDQFGGLYTWDVVMAGADDKNKQGICPDGWHIPDDIEWRMLIENIGGADSASYKLKKGLISGFNLQYGGNYHSRLKNFNFKEKNAYYWTASPYSKTAAWIWMFGKNHLNANRSTVPIVYGLSLRCIKDQ